MKDRRSQKSESAIKKSFLELLEKKSLPDISVAEICRGADVGRGTFYLHYRDAYDLYNKIEDELYSGLYLIFENAFPSTNEENSLRLTKALTAYIEENRTLFLLLSRGDNSMSKKKLKDNFNRIVLSENRTINPKGDSTYDRVEVIFVVSGMVGVLENWLTEGMKTEGENIALMLNKILLKINREI